MIEVIVLGTAQDGGVPHPGCRCSNCCKALEDPRLRRYASCIGIIDPAEGKSWLVDATPDLREQIEMLRQYAPDCSLNGILLTHAHIGHYLGLAFLGREAMNTDHLPVYSTKQMSQVIQRGPPWSLLLDHGNIELKVFSPRKTVSLSDDLSFSAFRVPHRDETADTVAYRFEGQNSRLFYCPDADTWDLWDTDPVKLVSSSDIALIDGTFYSPDELPWRNIETVPHPPVLESIERFDGLTTQLIFTHLNHSNPLLAEGPERELTASLGRSIAERGMRFTL